MFIFFFFFPVNSFFVGGCNCEIVLWSKNNFTEFSQKGFVVLEKGMMKFLWLRLNIVESYFFLLKEKNG